MAQLELFSLQSGAGPGDAGEPALLALSDSAPRQIPQRICGTHGQSSGAAVCGLRCAGRARDLGARGFRRRSARRQRTGGRDAAELSAASRADIDYDRHRTGTRPQALRRRQTSSTSRWISRSRSGRIFSALRPELVVLAETEFWPNFLRLAHASGARIAVVNARISDRSWPQLPSVFAGHCGRCWRTSTCFWRRHAEDSARLQSIGAEPGRVQVTGNLKFDVSLPAPPPIVESLRRSLAAEGAGPVLVCGSTVEDEEPPLLKAFENLRVAHPRAVMILAPRHPERFDDVAILLQQLGIRSFRRSQWQGEALAGGVLLVDTIGELAALYASGRCCIRRRKPGAARRAQHHRTGAARRGHRDWELHGKLSRHCRPVSKPRRGADRGSGGVATDADAIARGRCGTAGARPPGSGDDAIADGRDVANPGSTAEL